MLGRDDRLVRIELMRLGEALASRRLTSVALD